MSEPLEIQFASLSAAPAGTVVLLAGQELALAPTARGLDERMKGALSKAARAADFTGKAKTTIEILAPSGIDTPRLLLLGTGRPPKSWTGCCSAATRWPRSAPARATRRAWSPSPPIPGEASA